MTTLAEHIIVARAENSPPMLEKSMYDSWASRIRLFIKGNNNERMMLDPIDNGPLVYQTVEENGQTRPKKYFELTEAQQLQDDYDVQATNIILHSLPPDVYSLVNHQATAKDIWDGVKLLIKGTELSYQERECRLYNLMTMQQVQVNTKFLNALPPEWSKFHRCFHLQTINSERLPIPEIMQPFKMEESQFNKFKEDKLRVLLALETKELLQPQWETMQFVKQSCDSDVLSEVPYSDTYLNDMINQDVQEMPYSEQTHIVDFPNNEITSDSNIISNLDKENQTNKMVNESLTAKLERYKECVAIFEQRIHVDLNKHEKLVDSQIDDLIQNKNAKFAAFQQEINTLKETLSNQVKEKESLSTILTVFKTECKEKESKYMD
ncbi:hypothetical protein Tco_0827345 [Tanacetum coccineum]